MWNGNSALLGRFRVELPKSAYSIRLNPRAAEKANPGWLWTNVRKTEQIGAA
jgi:hypothetical protein